MSVQAWFKVMVVAVAVYFLVAIYSAYIERSC